MTVTLLMICFTFHYIIIPQTLRRGLRLCSKMPSTVRRLK